MAKDKRRIAPCWTCAIVVVFSVAVRGQSFRGLRGALKDGGGSALSLASPPSA